MHCIALYLYIKLSIHIEFLLQSTICTRYPIWQSVKIIHLFIVEQQQSTCIRCAYKLYANIHVFVCTILYYFCSVEKWWCWRVLCYEWTMRQFNENSTYTFLWRSKNKNNDFLMVTKNVEERNATRFACSPAVFAERNNKQMCGNTLKYSFKCNFVFS